MATIYQHRHIDTNQVFYIGYTETAHRPYIKERNKLWKEYAKKPYVVEILITGISSDSAYKVEEGLIEYYGRIKYGGILTNKMGGGKDEFKKFGMESNNFKIWYSKTEEERQSILKRNKILKEERSAQVAENERVRLQKKADRITETENKIEKQKQKRIDKEKLRLHREPSLYQPIPAPFTSVAVYERNRKRILSMIQKS